MTVRYVTDRDKISRYATTTIQKRDPWYRETTGVSDRFG